MDFLVWIMDCGPMFDITSLGHVLVPVLAVELCSSTWDYWRWAYQTRRLWMLVSLSCV